MEITNGSAHRCLASNWAGFMNQKPVLVGISMDSNRFAPDTVPKLY